MTPQEKYQERIEIINDAVRMKKAPARVPFATLDAFWRYQDQGYKLSEALLDQQIIEDAVIEHQNRYEFDFHLDIGDRNPLILTRSLGNFEYGIDDERNTLMLKEQCCFNREDYDKFAENPVRTFWEDVMPRKYSYFKPGMDPALLQQALGNFLGYNQAMGKTVERLKEECGVPQIAGTKFWAGFECLYNFLRGMKGLSGDLRQVPDKVLQFIEVFDDIYIRPDLNAYQKPEVPNAAFNTFAISLSQNMINKKQYGKFAWPHFMELANKMVETDSTMFVLSEGTLLHIADYIRELPKGHFCFYVEKEDIIEIRKLLPNVCLCGGLPLSLMGKGTPQQCIERAKRVIEEVGKDGGLILTTDKFPTSAGDVARENLQAVSEFVRSYR